VFYCVEDSHFSRLSYDSLWSGTSGQASQKNPIPTAFRIDATLKMEQYDQQQNWHLPNRLYNMNNATKLVICKNFPLVWSIHVTTVSHSLMFASAFFRLRNHTPQFAEAIDGNITSKLDYFLLSLSLLSIFNLMWHTSYINNILYVISGSYILLTFKYSTEISSQLSFSKIWGFQLNNPLFPASSLYYVAMVVSLSCCSTLCAFPSFATDKFIKP
jgi:hypothetical protein